MLRHTPHLFHKLRTWSRPLHNEKGNETLEWLGMIMVVLALLGSVAFFMSGNGATPVAESMRDTVEQFVAELQGEPIDGGTVEGGVVSGSITGPALGVPSLAGNVVQGNVGGGNGGNGGGGDDGGGSCGWFQWACDAAGAAWNGVTGAVSWAGQQISSGWTSFTNWWNSEAANWFKGLLVGLAATVVVVVGLVALVAAAVISVPVAIVAGIVAAIAAIGVGIWYALTQVNGVFGWENVLPAFGLSLGAGIIAAGIVVFIGSGAAAATWAWITRIALPAILSGIRTGWQAALNGIRFAWQWLGTVALPAIRAFIARSWANIAGFFSGLWTRFAGSFLGRLLISGFKALGGWRAALRLFVWNGIFGGIVFVVEVLLGWRAFDFGDPWAYVGFIRQVLTSGILGVVIKWASLGVIALGLLARLPRWIPTRVITWIETFLRKMPVYTLVEFFKQLPTKFILPVIKNIPEVFGWVTTGAGAVWNWVTGWFGGGSNTPAPTPVPGPVPVPAPTPPTPTLPPSTSPPVTPMPQPQPQPVPAPAPTPPPPTSTMPPKPAPGPRLNVPPAAPTPLPPPQS